MRSDPVLKRDDWRFGIALLLSLLAHALLLSLSFGEGPGLPGLDFPWKEKRFRADDLRVRLAPRVAPVPVQAPQTDPVASALGEPALDAGPTADSIANPMGRTTSVDGLAAPIPAAPSQAGQPDEGTPAPASGQAAMPPPASVMTSLLPSAASIFAVPSTSSLRLPDIAPEQSSPEAEMPTPADVVAHERLEQIARERALELARIERATDETALETRRQVALTEIAREAERKEAERQEIARLEQAQQERARHEQAQRENAQREVTQQEATRLEAARLAAAQIETARLATMRLELQRADAERQEAAKKEAARQDAAKQEAIRIEAARVAAAQVESARQAAARQELERAEAARLEERQEAARQEAARQERARQELARQEQLRQEQVQREKALQEAARLEAIRQTQLEATRQAAAKQELERAEAARVEAERQEAARQERARQEQARQEQSQREKAQQDAARLESARQANAQEAARQEAARQERAKQQAALSEEAAREARLRAIGRQLDEERDKRDADSRTAGLSPKLLPLSSGLRRARLFGRTDPNAELVLYAEAWGRKIQMNTSIDTVREIAKLPHTHPLVTVAIRSDGSVEKVTFVTPSGAAAVDEAIRQIVQSQAPYSTFSSALSREYDVIEIRRSWIFDTAIRLE